MSWWTSIRNVVEKVAPPVIGYYFGGPVGAAIGGAAGSAARGGDLGQIIQGAGYGYGGGSALSGLTAAAGAYAGAPAVGTVGPQAGGISSALSSLGGSISGALPSGMGGSGGMLGSNPLLSLANLGSTAYSAIAGRNAANTAAGQLQAADNKAIGIQNNAIAANNTNVAPYMAAGGSAVAAEQNLINDPNAQKAFVQNNPFYKAMADDTQNRLFANAASKGTLGSGGTQAALQNSLLLLGQNLVNNNVSQNQALAGLGEQSASNLNSVNNSATNNLTNLTTEGGNAAASGTIGGYNATTKALNNGLLTQGMLSGAIKGQTPALSL
jgi:hypothetical protein